MVTRIMVMVVGLLNEFMLLKEKADRPNLLTSKSMLENVTWRQNRYILIVRTVNLESCAIDIWVSAKKLPLLPANCARSTSVMRQDVWRKFAVRNLMLV